MSVPDHWVNATLGDLFEPVGGGTPSTGKSEYWGGKVPWISSADIDEHFKIHPRRHATVRGVSNSATSVVPVGSVIVVTRVGLGKVGLVSEMPTCFSQDSHALMPLPGIDSRFTAYQMKWAARRFIQQSRGTTVAGITTKQLDETPFLLPPSAEQTRIADTLDELFSDLDAGVEALKRVREKLKLYRASVLKAAVEGKLTADWRRQNPDVEPASELLKCILTKRRKRWEEEQLRRFEAVGKNSPRDWRAKYREPTALGAPSLPPLPEGWSWVSFDQIGETQGGLQKSPSREPRSNHFPYLRVANVHRGSLDLRELHRFELSREELDRLRLQSGDILIVEGNGSRSEIGRSAMWRGEVEDCVHQNHIIRVRPLQGIIPKYVDIFLNSPDGQRAIQWVASSTSGLYTLSISKIERLPLSLPPTAEQQIIVELVENQLSVLDHLEADFETKLKGGRALRQSVLRHAFMGYLVPQDQNDEPASKLLSRIAASRGDQARLAVGEKNKRKGIDERPRRSGKKPARASK